MTHQAHKTYKTQKTHKTPQANTTKQILIALLMACFALTSCANDPNKKKNIGGIAGGVLGGYLGSKAGKGDGEKVATIAGALLGAYVGSQIGEQLDEADKLMMQKTTTHALNHNKIGESSFWKSQSNQEISGSTTPTKDHQEDGRQCRTFTQTLIIDNEPQKQTSKACQMPDGSWELTN